MFRRTRAEERHALGWRPRSRRGPPVLMLGLALVVALTMASCGTTSTSGGQPTATARPTATMAPSPSPQPCTEWRVVVSPNGTKYQMNGLAAVSSLSPSLAWAVGANYGEGTVGPVVSLIEQWDGIAWHIAANPSAAFLSGVAAISPTDVWAVGKQWESTGGGMGGWTTVTMHWNGTQWSIVPSAKSKSVENILTSVAAISANDVWAVGDHIASGARLPLAEHWDGTSWHAVATPVLSGVTESTLSAVAPIPGTQQAWAVGYTLKGPRPAYEHALIERWDGAAWQVIPGPALPGGSVGGKLSGVAALSATDAWVVGEYYASDHIIRILNAHWDGAAWRFVSSPDVRGTLSSVAATGPADVRAVGHSYADSGQHALIEQWDGTAWHLVTTPQPRGAFQSDLSSIAADGAGNYWAVGRAYHGPEGNKTLTLHCL